MNIASKKVALIALAITSLFGTRTVLVLFNDPEGPNLLIILVGAAIVYALSLIPYFLASSLPGSKKLLLAILVQAAVLAAFFYLG